MPRADRLIELTPVPGNPVPVGAITQMVTTSDGIQLRATHWPNGGSRGTVVIAHGRGDFIERYFETVRDLQARDFAVASFDFRGQGGSSRMQRNPYRGAVRRFSKYEEDLAAVMTAVVLPDCPPPYYVLGHSTGALVALATLRRHTWFEKVILTSPLLGVHPGMWPLPLARFVTRVLSLTGGGAMFLPGYSRRPLVLNGFNGNPFTSDRRRFQRDVDVLRKQPSLGIGGPTFGWLSGAFKCMDDVHSHSRKTPFKTPILIVASGWDQVVNTEYAREFAAQASGVSLVIIQDAMHEILNEHDAIREQFFAAFDAFVDQA